MSDAITTYKGGNEVITTIDAPPDPAYPGYYLLKSGDGAPLCCKLLLKTHAYNIVMPPGSYIVIDADEAGVLSDSRSNDRAVFVLPSDNPKEFYIDCYVASMKGIAPYTVLALRQREKHQLVSAALYPRDLQSLPPPLLLTKSGRPTQVETKRTATTAAAIQDAGEFEFILNAIYRPSDPAAINAPKADWF